MSLTGIEPVSVGYEPNILPLNYSDCEVARNRTLILGFGDRHTAFVLQLQELPGIEPRLRVLQTLVLPLYDNSII
jgi:hypothetical protein